jgi:alkylhydroperoxidase family enzyme
MATTAESGGAPTDDERFGGLQFLRITDRDRPTSPRLAPLTEDELDERAKQALDETGLGRSNMLTTLVRHPGLFRHYNRFGGKLIRGRMPGRERELLILRTTWRCGCDFLWESHVRAGMKVGLSLEEAERTSVGAGAPGWSPLDAALLRAVDELFEDSCITDATWNVLADALADEQLIEVVMLVGFYLLNCFSVNSLGIQLDSQLFGHPAERSPSSLAAANANATTES